MDKTLKIVEWDGLTFDERVVLHRGVRGSAFVAWWSVRCLATPESKKGSPKINFPQGSGFQKWRPCPDTVYFRLPPRTLWQWVPVRCLVPGFHHLLPCVLQISCGNTYNLWTWCNEIYYTERSLLVILKQTCSNFGWNQAKLEVFPKL